MKRKHEHYEEPQSTPPVKRVRLRELVLGPDAKPPPTMSIKPRVIWGKKGRPPFEPTNEQRRYVELCITNGIPHTQIAAMIENPISGKPIGLDTLTKYFASELALGHVRQKAVLAGSIFKQAVGADAEYDDEGNQIRPALAPNLAAGKWYEQSRFGYKEGTQVFFTDAEGKPLAAPLSSTTINQVIFVMPKNGFETRDRPMKDVTPEPKQIEGAVDGED